ncbi:MAG: superoxide dismutase family protein [Clostridia bacterium]|nr:superoxide dismutase family protein [Clostridia bacterium]
MQTSNQNIHPAFFFRRAPSAFASLKGDSAHPMLFGSVLFYEHPQGTLVAVELRGLPTASTPCSSPVFALHIHEGGLCSGNASDPFAQAGAHYNPQNCPHPYHAGDLPPIFSAGGQAFSAFLTDRFTVREVTGRTVILHALPDDFSTQPAGGAGRKIACGEILGRERVLAQYKSQNQSAKALLF